MKALLPQIKSSLGSVAGGRAAGGGGTGGNASVLAAIAQARNGDMALLENLNLSDANLTEALHEFARSEETVLQGGTTAEGAVWADLGTRVSETEAQAVSFGGGAETAASSVLADDKLPDAIEINDTGAVQDWSGVHSDMAGSTPFENQGLVKDAVGTELGTSIGENYEVHVDREAWRVAGTYNCDAAIIGQHVFVHRRIEESISQTIYGGGGGGGGFAGGAGRKGGLIQTEWRPPFAQLSGSDIVMTDGNYTIEMSAPTVIIYDQQGCEITKIWGDPHVNENGAGSAQWHFGEDSTFILPDGTKVCCDTEPNSNNEWYTVGVDVVSGNDRFHHGEGGESGMTKDALEWDLANADRSTDESAGVFALQDNNQWAFQANDGNFYDITNETWDAYKSDRDIDFGAAASGLTDAQLAVAGDADLKNRAGGGGGGTVGRSRERERETHTWMAMQEVEVDAQTGEVVNPLQYMPDAERIFPRGTPNYIPGVDREMNVSEVAEHEAVAGRLIDEELNVTMGWYNVHMDEEAWKVAHTYNTDLVLWGQEMFVHHDIYKSIADEYHSYQPPSQGGGNAGQGREGFLMEPLWRAPFLKHTDSAVVITPAGWTIEMKGHEVIIYDNAGKQNTRIWGDPHVNEGEGGDNWHFGNDSTFVLPDGTKLCLDTKETKPGVYFTVGVDILCGSERYHYGEGGDQGMTEDAIEWDAEHADSAEDAHAGVFALQDNGEWAILADDGNFYDITDETWSQYLKDKDVDWDPNKVAQGLTDQQLAVADDADIKLREEALRNGWGAPRTTNAGGKRVRRFDRLFVEREVMMLLLKDDVIEERRR